jgi:radical SAM protein with 4Fe4S-binding SPASM domain
VVRFATYCRSGYHHKDKLFNHPDDFRWLDKEIDKLKEEFPDDDIFYQNGAPLPEPESLENREQRWKDRSYCTAGRTGLVVCASGKVVACEQMPERDGDYLGDLRTQSIQEVWKGKDLDEYLLHPPMERFKGTPCYECEDFEQCQSVLGQCVRDCVIHYGTRWTPTPACPRATEYKRVM